MIVLPFVALLLYHLAVSVPTHEAHVAPRLESARSLAIAACSSLPASALSSWRGGIACNVRAP